MKRVPSGNQTGQREIPKKIENRGFGKNHLSESRQFFTSSNN